MGETHGEEQGKEDQDRKRYAHKHQGQFAIVARTASIAKYTPRSGLHGSPEVS
jgi:hypothetical protein